MEQGVTGHKRRSLDKQVVKDFKKIDSIEEQSGNNTSDSDSSRNLADEKRTEEQYLDGLMIFNSEKAIFALTDDCISYTKVSTSKKGWVTNHISN